MSKMKKIFNSLILGFAALGTLGMGLVFSGSMQPDTNTAVAELQDYDTVHNSLPKFFIQSISDTNVQQSDGIFLLTSGSGNNIGEIHVDIATDTISGNKKNITGPDTAWTNYTYVPRENINPKEPQSFQVDSTTEFYYFSFSNSLSLYYGVTNDQIENGSIEGLENLLTGASITDFTNVHEDPLFIEGYDLTPAQLNIDFRLNAAASKIETNGSIVTLDKEGCYTLAVPVTYYHTTDNGKTFSTTSDIIYYTFMVFDAVTYFDSATNLPNAIMSNVHSSSLANSQTHAMYYFYNYNMQTLPTYTYNPNKYQLTLQYTDRDENATTALLEFDPSTKTISQLDENGNPLTELKTFITTSYNTDTQELTLIFNNLGTYDISFQFLYVTEDNNIFELPLKSFAKNQRLYIYGYQSFYTDYSKIDPDTNTTLPQEFKQIEHDKFVNSADITYLLGKNDTDNAQAEEFSIEKLKNDIVGKINEKSIDPVSTNQTPVKFSSNVSLNTASKLYQVSLNSDKNADKIFKISEPKTFDGLNINTAGTYLAVIDYTYGNYLSSTGTVQSAYHHYQIFYFTVENKTPTVDVIKASGKDIGNDIYAKGFTNTDVWMIDNSASTLYDAQVTITLSAYDYQNKQYIFQNKNIKDFATSSYGITYYAGNLDYYRGDTPVSGGTGIHINSENAYANATFTISIYSTNASQPSTRTFSIDTLDIAGLNATNVKYATSANYTVKGSVDGNKTNQPIIFSWDQKASGAQTYGYYKYYPISNTAFYNNSSSDTLVLYTLLKSYDMVPVNAALDLSEKATWTSYVNALNFKTTVPSSYVRSSAGLYVVEVYDDAGNVTFDIYLLDNTSPLFVKTIETESGTTTRSILGSNDTITVSESYTAMLEWGNYKGIYVKGFPNSGSDTNNLYTSYSGDRLGLTNTSQNNPLRDKFEDFFGANDPNTDKSVTVNGIATATPENSLITTYNSKYLKIKINPKYYFKDATSSLFAEANGNTYAIRFFTEENEALEGTYKFLLRDASNTQMLNNDYDMFLNYPSSFVTMNVTSDSSQLKVLLAGTEIDKEGYTLSGNFYVHTDGDNNQILNKDPIKADGESIEESTLTYKYAYYTPIKSESSLTLSYVPVAGDGSRVQSVTMLYYPYLKQTKKIISTKQDGTTFESIAYYYTLSETPTKSVNVFEYSEGTSYITGQAHTYNITFSGTDAASAGKYMFIRTYSTANGTSIDKYDYYERDLTLMIDRYNVISAQESVTNDENGSASLESIVGGDILISMYEDASQASIQVAFPTYNPDTGLNSGSFYTKSSIDDETILTPVIRSNKLPLSLKVPGYKYTTHNSYDYGSNDYTVYKNDMLSLFGNAEVRTTGTGVDQVWEIWVEGIRAKIFTSEEEAYAYLATTTIEEYKLASVVKFVDTTNKTFYYRTNGTMSNGYLNYFSVASASDAVPAGATPVTFTKPGIYDVTISQANNQAATGEESNFKSFYRFAFEITAPEPEFTVLTGNDIEINSIDINGIESYYTNAKDIKIRWIDSDSNYIANLDRNPQNILIEKHDRSSTSIIPSSAIHVITDAKNPLIHSISFNLGSDGLDIWRNGSYLTITMQLEGHNREYYSKVTKNIYVDFTAPTENLSILMNRIASSTTLFDRLYQEKNMRYLQDFEGKELDTSRWTNGTLIDDYLQNVSYSYSMTSGMLKYYAYNVTSDYFLSTLKQSTNANTPTTVQQIYYQSIGNVADLQNYNQVTKDSFSSYNYENISNLDSADLLTINCYYEIVEMDTAGNMTVYIVHLYQPDATDANGDPLSYALTYTNGLNENVHSYQDSDIQNGANIFSNSGFTIESLNYLSDSWGFYNFTLNGVNSTYMLSPWLMFDANNQYDPNANTIYKVSLSSGKINFTTVQIQDIFKQITSSARKHSITFTDRFTGINQKMYVSVMDASLTTTKKSDTSMATLSIGVPSNEEANSTTTAYLYPVQIKIYQFVSSPGGGDWSNILTALNASGNPANWVSNAPESVAFTYTAGTLNISITLGAISSQKIKYDILDNFGNTTTVIQLANEETCQEVVGGGNIYKTDEPDGSITYLSSDDITYQFNNLIYKVLVSDATLNSTIVSGTRNIEAFKFVKSGLNYDKVYTIRVFELETYKENVSEPVRVVNIRLYHRLPTILTDLTQKQDSVQYIWFKDKNNEMITNYGIEKGVTVTKDQKAYTADATSIVSYSTNITIFFDNGQLLKATDQFSYNNQYPYSVYISSDGNLWLNINNFAETGYRISGSGNYKVLVTYDDTNYFTTECKIFNITILDSSSIFYYVTVDGNIIEKSDIKYTDDTGKQHYENYVVGVNYTDKSDRISVVGNEELNVTPVLVNTIPTGTNVYVDVWYYECDVSSGYFTIIYIGETSSILTLLTYEDASGSPISLLGNPNATIVANDTETDYARLKITWTGYYGITENSVNVEVLKLFNDSFIPVNITTYTSGNNRYLYLTRSGTYRIRFYDCGQPANVQGFASSKYLNLVFLNSVPFTVTYTDPTTNTDIVTEPITNAVYNGAVKLSLVNLSSYFQTSGYPTISVFKEGVAYTGYSLSNYVYTFTETGYYAVTFTAKSSSGISVRQETFIFTIINQNESRYAYEFTPYANYYIESVYKDNRNITKNLLELAGNQVVIVDGQKYLSQLLISYFDEKTGSGRYTITVNTGESSYSEHTATRFTFGFWINLATPPVEISVAEGASTTDIITLSFNPQNLYNTIGDCYIQIATDRYDINEQTINDYGATAKINIVKTGTYYIQIYSTSNNLLFSYKVIKAEPMNTWTIIAIVLGVVALAVIILITIKLRKRLKVK